MYIHSLHIYLAAGRRRLGCMPPWTKCLKVEVLRTAVFKHSKPMMPLDLRNSESARPREHMVGVNMVPA